MLRLSSIPKNKEQYFYKAAIEYLHNIKIPKNVFININEIEKDKNSSFYLILNKHKFFIDSQNLYFVLAKIRKSTN